MAVSAHLRPGYTTPGGSPVLGSRRLLLPGRAARNLQKGWRSARDGEYMAALVRALAGGAEMLVWLAARIAAALVTIAGLTVLLAGVAARQVAYLSEIDDPGRIDMDQLIEMWIPWLLLIPWALGLISLDRTALAAGRGGSQPGLLASAD